jgi:streptomycin 6-kinase
MTTTLNTLQLPKDFTDRVIHSFAHKGEEWLRQLPQLVETCVERWQLTDLRLSPELFYALMLFARQDEFGEVVLKVGVPHLELFAQIHAIPYFDGHGLCRCFALDESLGAMLLERVLPGENLWTVTDPAERYEIAAGLYRQMVIPPPAEHRLPLFRERLETAAQRTRQIPGAPEFLTKSLGEAVEEYHQLEAENGGPMLLHCDLNHGNILRDHLEWRAIDPNGFIGARPIECARFIENEIRLTPAEDQHKALHTMTALFSGVIGCSQSAIAQAVRIDNLLNTFLCIEFNAPNEWIESGLTACTLFQTFHDSI